MGRKSARNGERCRDVLLAIISDIHANYEALSAVYLDILSQGCDKIICLGDVVGYGASPIECIDFMMENNITCLRGNHDSYAVDIGGDWKIQPFAKEVIYWLQEKLDPPHMDWLRNLPFQHQEGEVTFVHSSLEALDSEYWPYILSAERAHLHFYLQVTMFCFYGHTHIPLIFAYDKKMIKMNYLRSQRFDKYASAKYLINCGSVGQPRDYDKRAAYALFNTETLDLKLRRCDYDFKMAQRRILDAGLPEILAERLSHGL